jgi:hypothetical protein
MRNPIFDKLLDTLEHGGLFSHTNVGHAELFFAGLDPDTMDQVSVAITGDSDLTDKAAVSNCITSILSIFERKVNVRIQTGQHDGVEAIVRQYATRNHIEVDIHDSGQIEEWTQPSVRLTKARDRRMVAASHVVVVITQGLSKECKYITEQAIQEGRLVTVRKIKQGKTT